MPSMEERFMGPEKERKPSRLAPLLAALRYFLLLASAATAVSLVLGLVVGVATGHSVLESIVWGLWIGGGILLVLGGSTGTSRGSGVAARQLPSRRLLPGQIDPVGLILIGAIPLGIGIAIAVLTGTG